MRVLERGYSVILGGVIRYRVLVVIGFFAMLLAIFMVIAPRVPFLLFPQDDARSLYLKVSAPIGTPIEQTEAIITGIETQLMQIAGDELRAVTARIGHKDPEAAERQRGEAENEGVIIAIFKDLGRKHTNVEWIQILEHELVLPADVTLVFQSEYVGPPTDQPVTLHMITND